MAWGPRSLPSQEGKTFVVTGGNRGIGYFVSEQLATTGARVILASRNRERTDAAIAAILQIVPAAILAVVPVDLGSLDSVSAAARRLQLLGPIDGLALNAGLTVGGRKRELTEDGLEIGVGTNYVAHFVLVAQTFSALAPGARIVPMGSMVTRTQKADESDLMQERGRYSWATAYANSKHAMQTFGFELDRRLRASGSSIESIVAHPGFSLDVQAPRRPGVDDETLGERVWQNLLRPMTQGKDRGAWPMVRALTDPNAHGGEYYGPRGAVKGRPVIANPVAQDRDHEFGRALWEKSESWAGLRFTL
jgi:NAD(P)-dependent dehydrogenase (short-subunit alcohol dehydrogenase family)